MITLKTIVVTKGKRNITTKLQFTINPYKSSLHNCHAVIVQHKLAKDTHLCGTAVVKSYGKDVGVKE